MNGREAHARSSFFVPRSSFRLPRGRTLTIPKPPAVMGVLNITPDSFSDGGVHFDHAKAVHAAMQMEEDGAAVIDIGGESTRPGSAAVPAGDEIARVVPVIEQIRMRSDVPISIDTRKDAVGEAAVAAGAAMINDISGRRHDPAMRELARDAGVAGSLRPTG